MRRGRSFVFAMVAIAIGTAPATLDAATTARTCRNACRVERRACVSLAKIARTEGIATCPTTRPERRDCRRTVRVVFRDARRSCRTTERESCRPCCGDDGVACSTTTSTSTSVTTTSMVTTSSTLPLPIAPEPVFESGLVRPLALSTDGTTLYATNAPDGRLEVFDVTATGLAPRASVPVGLEPVAVAVHDTTAWVVNHLSDSVSIVDVGMQPPRVVRTVLVGDEPSDVVFAGSQGRRAFVTAAHRGQNVPFDPTFDATGIGRADVWVFDVDGDGAPLGNAPLTIVTLFGDTPRALAVSPDGASVYAAGFLSGNRTATVPASAVCDGGISAAPCTVEGLEMPGGLPAPNVDSDGVAGPEVGLIARYEATTGAWRGPAGLDWRNAMRFSLPDLDVFAIDAVASPPVQRAAFSDVGTVLFGMATHPISGRIYVTNTEAMNALRFEGFGASGAGTVRGHLHESRVTVLDPTTGTARPRHLNPHLDYGVVPSPEGTAAQSIALPVQPAITPDGATLYVAALGSDAIAVLDTAGVENEAAPLAVDRIPVAGGPSGLLIDASGDRLYVMTHVDPGIVTVDLTTRTIVDRDVIHVPDAPSVRAGRRVLYDAAHTSSNGEVACASCHVFGDTDGLAWDLGDPDGVVLPNPLRLRNAKPGDDPSFHPLKGPMMTQTLRGIATHGSMHWRGDRTGGHAPGGDPEDERAAFAAFRGAFDTLLGLGDTIDADSMDAFTDFVLALGLPPNPVARLDGTQSAGEAEGEAFFRGEGDCISCHTLDPAAGFFGTDGAAAFASDRPQFLKIPHLRTLYTKVGRGFGTFANPPNAGDVAPMGDQIRGFGFTHDGAAGSLGPEPLAFLMAFPSDLDPIVGQQVTLGASPGIAESARRALLESRAADGVADLVAHGAVAGELRGWVRLPDGHFQSDRAAEAPVSGDALDAIATTAAPLTFTAVPPGTGVRRAIDRDGDGRYDGDERDAGSDPADPASPTP